MNTFLSVALGLSLILIIFGFLMDRAAINGGITGANGFPVFMATICSFLASLLVALIAGLFGGWRYLALVGGLTIPYHFLLLRLLVWRLEVLGRRKIRAREELARELRQRFPGK